VKILIVSGRSISASRLSSSRSSNRTTSTQLRVTNENGGGSVPSSFLGVMGGRFRVARVSRSEKDQPPTAGAPLVRWMMRRVFWVIGFVERT